jgi:hypothetical protein
MFIKQENKLTFKCGESTCAYDKGKFCRFFTLKDFGTKYKCKLFGSELFEDIPMGSIQRCEECKQEFN